jgi:ATP-binding cassette subfamily B protein
VPVNYNEEEDYESKFDGKTFRRILGLIRPHLRMAIGFLTAIMLVSVMDAYFTYLLKRILDEAIVPKNIPALINFLIQYGILTLIQAGLVFIFIYMVGILGERIRYDLRQKMFNHLQDLSLSYYSRTPVGWIMSRVTSDSERVSELLTWGLLDSTWAVMNVSTSMIFMLTINWKLALIVLGMQRSQAPIMRI